MLRAVMQSERPFWAFWWEATWLHCGLSRALEAATQCFLWLLSCHHDRIWKWLQEFLVWTKCNKSWEAYRTHAGKFVWTHSEHSFHTQLILWVLSGRWLCWHIRSMASPQEPAWALSLIGFFSWPLHESLAPRVMLLSREDACCLRTKYLQTQLLPAVHFLR